MSYKNLSFENPSKFLVTGGAGFIGSNLCRAILELGESQGKNYQVTCLDDLSTGHIENIEKFSNNPNFSFLQADIKDKDACMQACEGADYVLHQAAWGSVPRSIEMPEFYFQNNAGGTLNMLQAARECGSVKVFVYASSSSVYGDHPALPKVEGTEGKLLSPYALTKHENEQWAKQYTKFYNLTTIGLRYFNVFGPNQDPNGAYAAVIPRFIKMLLEGQRPTINGDGTTSRDFTYIENVIEANLKACLADKQAFGQAFNIAYGGRITLDELYAALQKALGVSIEAEYGPERPGDIKHSNADISKAKELLDYQPEYDFESGLKQAISWYRDNLA